VSWVLFQRTETGDLQSREERGGKKRTGAKDIHAEGKVYSSQKLLFCGNGGSYLRREKANPSLPRAGTRHPPESKKRILNRRRPAKEGSGGRGSDFPGSNNPRCVPDEPAGARRGEKTTTQHGVIKKRGKRHQVVQLFRPKHRKPGGARPCQGLGVG